MAVEIIDYRGHKYQMGNSFLRAKKGGLVRLNGGKLEIITRVKLIDNYDGLSVKTESGETYYSFLPEDIKDVGRRVA